MKHRILVIGCGSIGQRHIRCLQAIGEVEIAFMQRSTSKKPLNFDTTNATCVRSIKEGLEVRPEGVIIATPPSLHVEQALEVAPVVRNIFIEMPLAATMAGISELSNLAHAGRITVLMGFCLRFYDVIRCSRDLIGDSGELGRPLSVRAEVGSFLPDGRPDYREIYSASRALGGGVTLDLLHEVDYLCWIFGPIKSVIGSTVNTGLLGIETEDISEFIVKFESGLLGSVHMDYLQREPVRQLTVVCEKATLRANVMDGVIDLSVHEGGRRISFGTLSYDAMYVRQMRHFLSCIEGTEEPVTPLLDGIHSLRVGLGVHASSQFGKEVLVEEIQ